MRLRILAFLALLFIGPAFFTISYGHTAIPTEQNMTKDFMLSDELTASDKSVTSFSETLPDDTLFLPDRNEEEELDFSYQGSYGDDGGVSGSHSKTHKVDADYYGTFSWVNNDAWIQLDFQCPTDTVGFTVSFYCIGYDFDDATYGGDLEIYDTVSTLWDDVGDLSTSSGWQWVNYTSNAAEYWDTDISVRAFRASGGTDDTNVFVDYAEITYFVMTLADSNHYGESFADISDWSTFGFEGPDALSTDGDLGVLEANWSGSSDYDRIYSNTPSLSGVQDTYYVEIRYKSNTTNYVLPYLRLYTGDERTGNYQTWQLTKSTSWVTTKHMITNYDVLECAVVYILTQQSGQQVKFEIDYLRIAPANESGYQHDCSTLYSVEDTGMDYSSDGDHIQAEHFGGPTAALEFMVDTTSTYADIDPDYYLFLSWYCVNVSDDYTVRVVTSGGPQTIYTDISDTGLVRANIRAVTAADYYSVWFVTDNLGDTLALDFVKAYSVANWTIAQSGVDSSDYLYVDSGVLYSVGTFSYFELADDWDPDLNTAIYDTWNVTQSATAAVNVSWYVGGWSAWSDETNGTFTSGTLTDQLIRIYGAGHLSAITFLGILPQWHTIDSIQLLFDTPRWYAYTVIIRFVTPTITTGLEWFMMFLGLIMIPASTMYLVRGGRAELSRDKIFFTLIIFFVGWALLIGAIMP